MKKQQTAAAVIMAAVLLLCSTSVWAADRENIVQMVPTLARMETAETQGEAPQNLYALSAVLMDGDSGRVLFEKEGDTARANASTTKVLTCIVALENAPGDDYVEVSENAAAQPEVKLGLRKGEQYYLEDLLYSLMLKSHNDSAVAIAEHVAGSVEKFAQMMNEKARELGCTDTHFVTPNGLDAKDAGGEHHTTARDLALIMRYAIQNQAFLNITQTREHSFSDLSQNRQFTVHNANALFDMMDGVISGKTGFTGNAGYCYVCAVKQDGKTFIVALLGCGWPNNKTYKWSDTKALVSYGNQSFAYERIWQEPRYRRIRILNGVPQSRKPGTEVYLNGICQADDSIRQKELLLKKGQEVEWKTSVPETLEAPVRSGQKIGETACYLDGQKIFSCPIVAETGIQKIDYSWYVDRVFHDYFH